MNFFYIGGVNNDLHMSDFFGFLYGNMLVICWFLDGHYLGMYVYRSEYLGSISIGHTAPLRSCYYQQKPKEGTQTESHWLTFGMLTCYTLPLTRATFPQPFCEKNAICKKLKKTLKKINNQESSTQINNPKKKYNILKIFATYSFFIPYKKLTLHHQRSTRL